MKQLEDCGTGMDPIEYELFSLKSQLGALSYMKKCREDELKIINARISEIHDRMGELENVQGTVHTLDTGSQGTDA